jgi:hypothetical protein
MIIKAIFLLRIRNAKGIIITKEYAILLTTISVPYKFSRVFLFKKKWHIYSAIIMQKKYANWNLCSEPFLVKK